MQKFSSISPLQITGETFSANFSPSENVAICTSVIVSCAIGKIKLGFLSQYKVRAIDKIILR